MQTAIRVESLGKSYRVGRNPQGFGRYHTLRESLVAAPAALMRRMRNGPGGDRGDQFWALRDVGLEVRSGEIMGIIGHNGAGKSTLLKILSRITKPTTGRVVLGGRVGSLLEVGTGFHPELTGRENIYLNGSILGMSRREITHRFDEIVAFAEVERFLDTPVKRYSSGMYVRLAFAVAAHLEPEILLVDEVLAVGDAQFQKKCLTKMEGIAAGGRTIILVSHQMSLVQRISDRVALLEKGHLTALGAKEEIIARYLASGPEMAPPGDWINLSRSSRSGIGGARVIAARYRCPDAAAAGHPYPDGPLEVGLIIESESIRSVDGLAVRFFDRYGTLLINANISFLRLGGTIDIREGRNEVSFHIRQLHLNPGVYTIGFWVANSQIGDVVDHVSSAFHLDVMETPTARRTTPGSRGNGLVTCDYSYRVH
jgi:ABC-type polysaccharide/polyol phosphate transport system ATPase subunit